MADPGEQLWSAEDHPHIHVAIRRHTDRCFHAAEEEYLDGFIVQGILISRDEVAEIRRLDEGDSHPSCRA